MASKKKLRGECTYCGMIGPVTYDHIPPVGLFPEPRPNNLMRVPCCNKCNQEASLDDEYLQTIFALDYRTYDQPGVKESILPKTHRMLAHPKKRSFTRHLFSRAEQIYIKTPSGQIMPTGAIIVDMGRIKKVTERIVKGIFYMEYSIRLPDGYEVWTFYEDELPNNTDKIFRQSLMHMLPIVKAQPVTTLGDNIFSYRYAKSDIDDMATVWLLSFYNKIHCLGFTINRKQLSQYETDLFTR